MRQLLPLAVVLLAPAAATAQQQAPAELAIFNFIRSLHDPATGAYKVTADGKPSLRACNGALGAVAALFSNKPQIADAKLVQFVLNCYDPDTGGFAEPGSKPDVAMTSVGVLTAVKAGIPEAKFPKAVDYLHAYAKTFEDVRIGAAALEALKKKPDWLDAWHKLADAQLGPDGTAGKDDGVARETASVVAMKLRLGVPRADLKNADKAVATIHAGQRADGGFGKAGAKGSDLESTYRVMRALVLLGEKPKDRGAMWKFVDKCRHAGGGSGVAAGDPPTMSGTYYAAMIVHWLHAMEK